MPNKTRVLVLGGGFGGLYAALHLDKTITRAQDIEVTLVSRKNFLLLTLMLPEVAAGAPRQAETFPTEQTLQPIFRRWRRNNIGIDRKVGSTHREGMPWQKISKTFLNKKSWR